MRLFPPARPSLPALLLAGSLLAMSCLPGCARFQKVDVEREFKHFIALYEELNTFTEAVFLMEHSKVITGDLSDFLIQKTFESKLNLESIIDIIFFYKYSDFRNHENYLVVYRYVNQRLDTILQAFQAQEKFLAIVAKDHADSRHIRRYTREYRDYLQRIITHVEQLKEKTK